MPSTSVGFIQYIRVYHHGVSEKQNSQCKVIVQYWEHWNFRVDAKNVKVEACMTWIEGGIFLRCSDWPQISPTDEYHEAGNRDGAIRH